LKNNLEGRLQKNDDNEVAREKCANPSTNGPASLEIGMQKENLIMKSENYQDSFRKALILAGRRRI
jgi:hypothetical protein